MMQMDRLCVFQTITRNWSAEEQSDASVQAVIWISLPWSNLPSKKEQTANAACLENTAILIPRGTLDN